VTLAELIAEANRLSSKIDAGVRALSEAAKKAATAEMDYRQAKAVAWVQTPSGTVPERQAQVDAKVSDRRFARDYRAEAEHARYGPEVG